ncbi:cellulase family glycosylhydrolase [Bacillus toyonensis]|nr:cellulase family glycosylhydrolase [Bacillus toyonensis]
MNRFLKICISVLLLLHLSVISAYAENEDLQVSDEILVNKTKLQHIRDKNGRALILHGYNTSGSAKHSIDGMPWISETHVKQEAEELGSNFVRFLIFWSRIEPEPGKYDETYLKKVEERIEWYKKQGMYVLLDMHQDLYGTKFNGNGAPTWATYDDGLPVKDQDPWPLTYLQPGVMRAFDNFWNNKHQIQTHYGEMWKFVAQRFADHDAVIGYDIMNEPFGGSNIWPFFEAKELGTMYQNVIREIRSVDQNHWIFFEPQAFGVNQGLSSTLPKLQDVLDDSRLVYAPHLYPILLEISKSYKGLTKKIIQQTIQRWKNNRIKEAKKYETPLLLGEFGLNIQKEGAMDYVVEVLNMLNPISSGFTYWSNDTDHWGPYDASGKFNILARELAFPYPRAIAGNDVSWEFDKNTNILKVNWKSQQNITGPTEIFLSPKYYPNGWELRESSSETHNWYKEWDDQRHILKIYTPHHPINYSFTIDPK